MLRLEGQGSFASSEQCACGRIFAIDELNRPHRCRDCYTPELFCEDCMNDRHAYMPFHRLEVNNCASIEGIGSNVFAQCWNGDFFERRTLENTGLVLELGEHT